MNGLLIATLCAYAVWSLSMWYHRREVKDERGRLIVLKSNNVAYGVVLVGLSVTIIINRFFVNLSSHAFVVINAAVILLGLTASAVSMFIYNRNQ